MWITETIHDHATPNICPHSSPGLTPSGLLRLGVVEREVKIHALDTKSWLISVIGDITANRDKDRVINTFSRFRSRIKAAIDADCGFTESLLLFV